MTVVEMAVGMVVLLIAVGGTLGVISSFVSLEASSRETTVAYLEAQRTIEQLQAQPFNEVFSRFNASAADDPGAGPVPTDAFDVVGLDPQQGDADGRVGRILFPVDPAVATALREDVQNTDLGMPRDLNADGLIDNVNHAGDYMTLPVRVRVEWRGRSGNRFIELHTVLREE
jgi:hypothetical protein